jgi:hypothetical protein
VHGIRDDRANRGRELQNGAGCGAEATGYLHPGYAQSLSEFGVPRPLGNSGGWILERRIPETSHWDSMGCYPFLACSDWSQLNSDLSAMRDRLVSFAAVLDPFGRFDETLLRETFPDRVLRFKEHFVADLSQRPENFVCAHHRRNALKAGRVVKVEWMENSSPHIDEWLDLYANLQRRHAISDIRGFSRCAFTLQFKLPGFVGFRALHRGTVVGMLIFFIQDWVVHYHLGAYSPFGYQNNASFALFWAAIEYFTQTGLHWLNLGAGAGTHVDTSDGLSRFKRGWATEARPVYFCGRVLNREVYSRLALPHGDSADGYFPAYRRGEFCKKTKSQTE